jgi:hypothetical protein
MFSRPFFYALAEARRKREEEIFSRQGAKAPRGCAGSEAAFISGVAFAAAFQFESGFAANATPWRLCALA